MAQPMFVEFRTPDGSVVLVNPEEVREITPGVARSKDTSRIVFRSFDGSKEPAREVKGFPVEVAERLGTVRKIGRAPSLGDE